MAGYLDHYGAGDERREKRNKLILTLGAVGLLLLFLWFIIFVWDKTEILRIQSVARLAQIVRNHRQENRVKSFFELLQRQDYKAAYALWNCTDANPCRDYPFAEFMKDWGPASSRQPSQLKISRSRSCGSGVIVTVNSGKNAGRCVMGTTNDQTIGFSPFKTCQTGT